MLNNSALHTSLITIAQRDDTIQSLFIKLLTDKPPIYSLTKRHVAEEDMLRLPYALIS